MDVDFGLRVKFYREKAKMTQQELADKLGYSNKSSIAKIEAGAAKVHSFKIVKFAEALGCRPEDLADEEAFPVIIEYRNINSNAKSDDLAKSLSENEKFAALQSILSNLSKMDSKQIIRVERLIRALSED